LMAISVLEQPIIPTATGRFISGVLTGMNIPLLTPCMIQLNHDSTRPIKNDSVHNLIDYSIQNEDGWINKPSIIIINDQKVFDWNAFCVLPNLKNRGLYTKTTHWGPKGCLLPYGGLFGDWNSRTFELCCFYR
jgi:hypothetical protein